jgi:NAD(P)-dependent dehydrogenase (short-subunit alcohol dehydrogenase family)
MLTFLLKPCIVLAKLGARIIVGCRNEGKALEAVERIKKESKNDNIIFPAQLDLSSLQSVKDFVQAVKNNNESVDILINNAGIASIPHGLTKDGFEVTFATNHLGHFLLTNLLIDDIVRNKGRIINVSGRIQQRVTTFDVIDDITSPNKQTSVTALYGQSKLANVIFTVELDKRYRDQGVQCYSVHPGSVSTELTRNINPIIRSVLLGVGKALLKTPQEGAQTSIYAALVDPNDAPSGSFLSDCQVSPVNRMANDESVSENAVASVFRNENEAVLMIARTK